MAIVHADVIGATMARPLSLLVCLSAAVVLATEPIRLDTRGQDDVESKLGDWTRVECLCKGKEITVKVNDVTVNHAYDVFPAAGKIQLQTEGFEIWFRKVELRPLK